MATNGPNDVKTHEPKPEARLAMPREVLKLERVRVEYRLGKRTYPAWTPAMVEAIERYQKEGRRWYLLYDKLHDRRNLLEAWSQVEANGGAAGVSGETVERLGKTRDEWLPRLAEDLKERKYEVRPIRRKLIPKGDGSGRMRELGIPEVRDRVVQAAVVRVIEPIFEKKFLDESYGFRPERSAHQALAQVERAITTDRPYVVDADIRNCFGSIPHDELMEEVAEEISDAKLLALIERFIKADIVEEMNRWTPEEGTPQGAVLSPLLANIYLHKFDRAMTQAGYEVVRYADDFVVLCRTKEEAEAARKKAEETLREMGLEMHPEKTRVVDAKKDRFQFLGYEFWPGGREPRPSSRKKLHDRIRARTPRKSGVSMRETIRRLNPMLVGWYGYFRYSFYNVFTEVDGLVRRRLRSILRKFAKRRGAARREDNTRYPNRLFHQMGLVSVSQRHEREAGVRGLIAFPAKA
jgi:RNA-directed DNA polymerase